MSALTTVAPAQAGGLLLSRLPGHAERRTDLLPREPRLLGRDHLCGQRGLDVGEGRAEGLDSLDRVRLVAQRGEAVSSERTRVQVGVRSDLGFHVVNHTLTGEACQRPVDTTCVFPPEACVEYIRRNYNSWLTGEDTYWVGRHNPFSTRVFPPAEWQS